MQFDLIVYSQKNWTSGAAPEYLIPADYRFRLLGTLKKKSSLKKNTSSLYRFLNYEELFIENEKLVKIIEEIKFCINNRIETTFMKELMASLIDIGNEGIYVSMD